MTNIARKTRLVGPALIALVLLGLTAAACFSDPSAASPDAPSAISQAREAVSEPTVVLTKPPAPPTLTLAPTSRPTVASLTSVPTNAHCLNKTVTQRKWLPQIICYPKSGRQSRGRRHQQDGKTGIAGDDPRPLPSFIQKGEKPDPRRVYPGTNIRR